MRTVVLPIESSRESGRELLRGVARYSRLHGPWTFYWEPGGLDEIFPRLKNLNADGIILRDSPLLKEVLNLGLPVIVIGHHYEKIPGAVNIITDSKNIGRMASDHLLSCGFKHFAYCGLDDKPWSVERAQSFSRHLAARGYAVEMYQYPNLPHLSLEKEQERLAQWLASLPRPVGLMACNDDRSQQVLQACKIAGLKAPEEIAIIGVDNDELICDLADPPLSSVSVNFERAGFEGAETLDRLMRGASIEQDEILARATHVVSRHSTDVTAISDAEVAQAVRFIRAHAKQNISVSDVVNQTAVSRRILEKRFRGQLKRSILEEIRRVRVNLIAQMLVDSNHSITQIAMAMGFQGDEHVARYFRQEMNLSPLQYRKKFGKK